MSVNLKRGTNNNLITNSSYTKFPGGDDEYYFVLE